MALRDLLEQQIQQKMMQDQIDRDVAVQFTPSAGQVANVTGMLVPGAGFKDAKGEYPALPSYDQPVTEAFSQEPYPSMAENLKRGGFGGYFDASMQGLGVAGDATYGVPVLGAALGPTVGTALKGIGALGTVAKAAVKGRGITALTRPVFPAPQRMFDPTNKSFNQSLSDFDFEPGGRYLQMGKDKTDITGQIPQAGKISVGPDGKPSFMVSDNLIDSLPTTGKIIRTNLYKKKAGWKWTKPPEGFNPNPASDFPIVSVETGNKHYYTLAADFPDGVQLSRYAKKTSEPRLRPTTRGDLQLGKQIGEIVTPQGKKHPVYDQITAGSPLPVDDVGIAALKPSKKMSKINASIDKMSKADKIAALRAEANALRFGDETDKGIGSLNVDTSYRMQHQARGLEPDAVRLDDLTKDISGNQAGYPDDFYSSQGQRIYAPGKRFADDEHGLANTESYNAITKARGNPEAEVTIYRAVPKGIKNINEGDFVTLSPKYAELHGLSGYGSRGDEAGEVISQKVKVKDLIWDTNDVNEFGYFPISSTTNP